MHFNLKNTLFLVISSILIFGCFHRKNKGQSEVINPVNNILTIYCENSMVPYLLDLMPRFESEYQCNLKLVNDCSQNLIGLVNFSQQGDLFIPDSRSSLDMLKDKSKIYITDSVFIGYNRIILMVASNNPRNITGNLSQLSDSGISIVLANPETSSLGYQTKLLLEKYALYNKITKNVISLSIDSKGMAKEVASGDADVAISWESEMFQNSNRELIDSVLLANEYTSEVYAGILSCTQNPTLAKYFIDFVSSNEGTAVAKKYGLSKRQSPVF